MFDRRHYELDPRKQRHEARIQEGGVLYRVTSPAHSGRDAVLTGRGAEVSREPGRFNGPQQKTSYCSNNVLVGLAEVLFHMYRKVLQRIEEKQPVADIQEAALTRRSLVVCKVSGIDRLVSIESEAVRVEHDPRLCGTNLVFPDAKYAPFRPFADRIRGERRRGLVYPSARHSVDLCFALFEDESPSVLADDYHVLPLRLELVSESGRKRTRPCDPVGDMLHQTVGWYSFEKPSQLKSVDQAGLINPVGLPPSGYLDFVRRRYRRYPVDAVGWRPSLK